MDINMNTSFDKTIFELEIGKDCNLVLSSLLKNKRKAVNTANTVNIVETMNKNKEK